MTTKRQESVNFRLTPEAYQHWAQCLRYKAARDAEFNYIRSLAAHAVEVLRDEIPPPEPGASLALPIMIENGTPPPRFVTQPSPMDQLFAESRGYEVMEVPWPRTDAERGEVYRRWLHVLRNDPHDEFAMGTPLEAREQMFRRYTPDALEIPDKGHSTLWDIVFNPTGRRKDNWLGKRNEPEFAAYMRASVHGDMLNRTAHEGLSIDDKTRAELARLGRLDKSAYRFKSLDEPEPVHKEKLRHKPDDPLKPQPESPRASVERMELRRAQAGWWHQIVEDMAANQGLPPRVRRMAEIHLKLERAGFDYKDVPARDARLEAEYGEGWREALKAFKSKAQELAAIRAAAIT